MSTYVVPNVASRSQRLVRAMKLVEKGKVTHLSGSKYLVKSGEDHYVDLMGDQPCYCKDQEFRDVDCKHVTAVRLFRADPSLVKTIADWIAAREANVIASNAR